MKTFRTYLLLLLALAPALGCWAQYQPGRELTPEEVEQRAEADTSRLQVHGSIFTGFYSGWGLSGAYYGAAPRLTYQLKDNLWLSGTAFVVGGNITPSLAPYRGGCPPPSFAPGQTGLLAYGGTVSLQGKDKHNNQWGLHLTFVDDRAGLITPYLCSPFYHTNLFGMWDW